MGCCFSSDEDKDTGFHDPDERTRLLNPNHGDSNQPAHGSRIGPQYTQEPEKGDEQSAMARILHQNAREVIDVASNESPLEQAEYHDRARQYTTRLKMVMSSGSGIKVPRLTVPNGITAPQTVLGAPPISPAEIQLISSTADKNSKAMRDVRIQHREDLVVSFGVPVP